MNNPDSSASGLFIEIIKYKVMNEASFINTSKIIPSFRFFISRIDNEYLNPNCVNLNPDDEIDEVERIQKNSNRTQVNNEILIENTQISVLLDRMNARL